MIRSKVIVDVTNVSEEEVMELKEYLGDGHWMWTTEKVDL